MILDNLAANKTPAIRRWAKRENVELCLTPTSASWANPIEAQFGPVRTFVMGNSDYRNHPALARRLQDYLRWRNAHARHPDVLAAQRRERARIRSERQQRWGRPKPWSAPASLEAPKLADLPIEYHPQALYSRLLRTFSEAYPRRMSGSDHRYTTEPSQP